MIEPFNKHPVLGKEYDREIRPLIDIIDKLRRLGVEQDINLPTVIVVGDQSSGKSSIIEAISGVELPRGTGIVTRCPLELQLARANPNAQWRGTLSCRQKRCEISSPSEVGALVEAGQKMICGVEKDISEELLTLRIESPDAPDLTLIDLPGITRIPVKGQSSNVCTKIMDIIRTYVKNENAVILCVISSNLDLAVNEALNVANQYDPNKERTIGVLSKPDKADKYQKEDIIKLLKNEKFELKKGYIVVKCRSQDDLDNNLPLVKSLEIERKFFENDDYFCHLCPTNFGIPNLARKITGELKYIIKKTLPKLINEIKKEVESCEENIKKLPSNIPTEEGSKRIYLTKILTEALNEISCFLKDGKFKDKRGILEDINVYSDWRKHFNAFQESISNIQNESLIKGLSESKLAEKIENYRGKEFYGFYNYGLFEQLASDHVKEYKTLAENLLEKMNVSTKQYLFRIINDNFQHLTKINQGLNEIVSNALKEACQFAKSNIEIIFDGEKIIFTMDNELQKKFNPQLQVQQSQFHSKHESAKILHQILKSYLKIVQCRLCDILPITIRLWIHFKLLDVLIIECMKYANDPEISSLIEESLEKKVYREKLVNKYDRLVEAEREIEQFSNFARSNYNMGL